MSMKCLSASIFLFFFFLVCSLESQFVQNVADRLIASTVYLEIDEGRSHGTGFVVGEGLIATNYHVISQAESVSARLVGRESRVAVLGLTGVDALRDLAVLKVSGLVADPLDLGNSDLVRLGDVIYTVGNPMGLEGTFSEGRISNIQPSGIPGNSGKMLQFTASISRGSSGGAIVNKDMEVVGIVSQTRYDGQNLNFAVPSNALKELLANQRRVTPFSVPSGEAVSEVDKSGGVNLIGLVVLCIVSFIVLHFLPVVKSDKVWITIAVACGIGVTVALLRSGIVDAFSEPMRVLYHAQMSEQGLAHMLTYVECIPKLVMFYAKAISLIALMCLLLGLSNKIKGFEITKFFPTIAAGCLIVLGEWIVWYILPI